MTREDPQRVRTAAARVVDWVDRAGVVARHRARVTAEADAAFVELRARIVDVAIEDEGRWAVLPLRDADGHTLGRLARQLALPPLRPGEAAVLDQLTTEIPRVLRDVRSGFGLRRFFRGAKAREASERAARFLLEYEAWGSSAGVDATLDRLDDTAIPVGRVPVEHALAPGVGLTRRLPDSADAHLLEGTPVVVDQLPRATAIILAALAEEEPLRRSALDAATALRAAETDVVVAGMPVDRLRDATRERLLVRPLTDAGITSVRDVLVNGERLATLPGLGPMTARRIVGAAETLRHTTFEETTVRIDAASPSRGTHDLVRRLAAWDSGRRTRNPGRVVVRTRALAPLAAVLTGDVTRLVVLGDDPEGLLAAVAAVVERAPQIARTAPRPVPADPWADFLARPADYLTLLEELGLATSSEEAAQGGLPDEVVAAVRRCELRTDHLTVSLRGYQGFAARFALVQRKVVIGDEMGLGKTVEALGVLAHLWAQGARRFLVVCPAAVVTNWVREVEAKSSLPAHRLHGQDRDEALLAWRRDGGVAVTTYDMLGWLERQAEEEAPACVVVDEAHYIKNPAAKRSRRSARLIERAERAILLTGTPLENRVGEFRELVGYVRPDLVVDGSDLRPRLFRRQVAPAYLRRSQEDVLGELPELVEVEEWMPLSDADAAAYGDAVRSGNFQAMRQAAMLQGEASEKVQRLVEIVEEAEDNGRKVLVFSNYLDVLDAVARTLPGYVIGPLTGAVPAARRQEMVDAFTVADAGAALVAQIVAGGVGLNIQAASVVVICEPQLKPTTEWQAIARARRMGQLRSVQVHRLLSEEGVDARVVEILARKRALFAEFAAVSDTAEAAPEAFDVSDAAIMREVVEAEQLRLAGSGVVAVSATEDAVDPMNAAAAVDADDARVGDHGERESNADTSGQ